jgi:hypothetical protein
MNMAESEDDKGGNDLPTPSLANLQKTCDIFAEQMTLYKKEKISLALLRDVRYLITYL